MSDYNQEGQGKQDSKGQQPAPKNAGQKPPSKPGQQEDLPDQSDQESRGGTKARSTGP